MRKVRVQVQGPLIENTIRSLLPTSKVCGQRPFYSDPYRVNNSREPRTEKVHQGARKPGWETRELLS